MAGARGPDDEQPQPTLCAFFHVGAEGIAGTLQTLQNTADPREIALLAQNLEKLAPGEHRQEAIEAARDALAMAAGGKLEGADVAPLFEVLRSYGDTSVLTDLMQAAKQWNYYSAIALAQLPDGAGIPTLIEMAQATSSGRLNALEMLTQLSAQYSEARAALVEQAHANKIPPNMWPYLTPLLAGDLYHYQDSALGSATPGRRSNTAYVVLGNQHFYTAPAAEILTQDEINQRLAVIDELQSATTEPAALKVKVALAPTITVRFVGWLVIVTGTVTTVAATTYTGELAVVGWGVGTATAQTFGESGGFTSVATAGTGGFTPSDLGRFVTGGLAAVSETETWTTSAQAVGLLAVFK